MLGRLPLLNALLTIFCIAFAGCSKKTLVSKADHMVFLGHIYQNGTNDKIDFRLENVNFSLFDVVLLGGDLCVETTKDPGTVLYLDSIFNLSDPETHWSLGNHDIRNGNLQWIEQTTNKSDFYSVDHGSIRISILNTNLDDCTEMQQQYDMLVQSLQSDESITHQLIISHHAIWTAYLESQGVVSGANARHSIWRAHCPFQASSFEEVILPELLLARKNGVEVIWVAGDFGQKVSGFTHRTNEGIWYLGNGLADNGNTKPDSIMTFTWEPETSSLLWQFSKVDEFVNKYE